MSGSNKKDCMGPWTINFKKQQTSAVTSWFYQPVSFRRLQWLVSRIVGVTKFFLEWTYWHISPRCRILITPMVFSFDAVGSWRYWKGTSFHPEQRCGCFFSGGSVCCFFSVSQVLNFKGKNWILKAHIFNCFGRLWTAYESTDFIFPVVIHILFYYFDILRIMFLYFCKWLIVPLVDNSLMFYPLFIFSPPQIKSSSVKVCMYQP